MKPKITHRLAQKVKLLRKQHNLSLKDLSNLSNISVSYLKKIEFAQAPHVWLNHAIKLASAFNIELSELLN